MARIVNEAAYAARRNAILDAAKLAVKPQAMSRWRLPIC